MLLLSLFDFNISLYPYKYSITFRYYFLVSLFFSCLSKHSATPANSNLFTTANYGNFMSFRDSIDNCRILFNYAYEYKCGPNWFIVRETFHLPLISFIKFLEFIPLKYYFLTKQYLVGKNERESCVIFFYLQFFIIIAKKVIKVLVINLKKKIC